jgi:hypothetical protein
MSAALLLAVAIPEAFLHQYEDGPPFNQPFAPGEQVHLSFKIGGYKKTDEETPRVKMGWSVEVRDAKGVPVVEPKSEVIDAPLASQDKDWMPRKRHEFFVPPYAESGVYKVTISVRDELGATSATRELTVNVRSSQPAVEPSDKLVARNFRFLRSDDEGPPVVPAAYRQGDSVWARFEMVGFRHGERNRLDVSYGLEVLKADGSRIYAQPDAASDRDSTFYPKRFVQGVLSLVLQKDTPTGEYTIVLRLRDDVGKQAAESRHVFRVE